MDSGNFDLTVSPAYSVRSIRFPWLANSGTIWYSIVATSGALPAFTALAILL